MTFMVAQTVLAVVAEPATISLVGAFGFGAVMGWFLYYVNRYRKDEVKLTDVATLLGAIGGAAVLALFEAKSALFGAYGAGLAAGFFGYYLILLVMVARSSNFDQDWFLDGRRKPPAADQVLTPDQRAMGETPGDKPKIR
jgi:hypothetical protein